MSNNKYIPPHLRRKNNKKETKQTKEATKPELINSTILFPELSENTNNINNEYNADWKQIEKKDNNNVNTITYVYINEMSFIYDTTIQKGWIVLNKDKRKNRCNITQEQADSYIFDINENNDEFDFLFKPFKNIIPKKIFNRVYNYYYEYDKDDIEDTSFTNDSLNDIGNYYNEEIYDDFDDNFENISESDDYYYSDE